MTATDELRRLLDERGVEHEDRDDWGTWWSYNGTEACYVMSHGGIFFLNVKSVTPEQAIEATLGGDLQAENAKLRELVRELYGELDAATQYDAGGGRGVVYEFADRMRELGVEV